MEAAALWVSFCATAAAVASAVIAWFARRDALRAAQDATQAQKESAVAEGRSAAASERVAFIQSALFNGPPWTVSWFVGDTFLLTNDSSVDAIDVEIDGEPDEVELQVSDTAPRRVGAKSAFTFMFSPHMGLGFERNIVVTWRRDGSDELLHWQHPIPPRPR